METTKATKTISQVFEEFLADQKDRISAKTFSKYPHFPHPGSRWSLGSGGGKFNLSAREPAGLQ
jgi:hypothetical protein